MAQPQPLSVDDALERLINQFADPMAFFRELVQNAVDAGSEEIEIRFTWERGRMVVYVDDWGCGMTREVIETKLTRLFSSSKDGDRTKIGKFGIGFVSVFAIGPDAVCIDTSREGEHWRILFDEARQFSLIRRSEPVEGTKIQIHKTASRAEFDQFRARAREVVEHWCKHLHVEVRVEGEVINQPFDLALPCKVARTIEEEQIVVAHTLDGGCFAGFYNRGLTLLERSAKSDQTPDDSALLPGIAFKVSSARIEHTLTRDDVIRERAFERAMAQVRELAGDALAQVVAERLAARLDTIDPREATAIGPATLAELEQLWRARLDHARAGRSPALPVFRGLLGARLSPAALGGKLVLAERPSPTVERLEATGTRVVWIPSGSSSGPALASGLVAEVTRIDRWCTATPARDAPERARWQPLRDALQALLGAWGAKLAGIELGHVDAADPEIAERVAITQREFGEATPIDECGRLELGLFASRRVLVVSADHELVRSNLALAWREPELAAYLTIKAFLLGRTLDAATDEALALATSRLRAARRAGA